jgi:hypothetical protein
MCMGKGIGGRVEGGGRRHELGAGNGQQRRRGTRVKEGRDAHWILIL